MSSSPPLPETTVTTKPKAKDATRTRHFPPFNVILENDDYHSVEFVIEVLRKVLGCSEQKAFLLMKQAHETGLSVVWTGTREVAELKAEQIQSFQELRAGGVKLGPLGVRVEPAE